MQVGNNSDRYGLVAQAMHWAVALLILALFGLGLLMSNLSFETEEQITRAFFIFSLHKTLGLTVFTLAILRILWAILQPHPQPLSSHKPVEVFAAQVVHWLLYVLIFAMPLTGWLHHSATEGLAPIWGPFPQRIGLVPQTEAAEVFWGWAHFLTAWVMGAIIALHIAGAMKHAVLDRDGTLRRMIPGMARNVLTTPTEAFKVVAPVLALLVTLATGAAIVLTVPHEHDHSHGQATTDGGFQSNWSVVAVESTLAISVIQNGNPVAGQFGVWTAEILFDSESPEAAQLAVDIDITSLTLGSVSQQALSADYLNAEAFPTARFASTGFTPVGKDQFETQGILTLAGVEKPLVLSFTLALDGDAAQADGTATILRLDHNVGPEAAGTVGHEVELNFSLTANRL